MAGQATQAVVMAVLLAIVIIVVAVSAAAAAALVTSATCTAIGLAERVLPQIQPLAALALTPNQALIMAAMQAGSLSTITELMQQINLVMITATL
ncbi:hypothetical protein PS918_00689 [Pseudomonas fluorescens]|uniref:Uncharacterized protein n=1 Tax=Pseudomonas fluorescens TaxID=294 RepID=A0A5E7R240_PSEFL|nr:hypothetical protein [Pseudomonas fluorescens]VVP68139.1 hypothetical protein PS918_00689 [Pseudomonas fluorescens]